MKRFACQDIIPGCDHVFTGADDQSVLDQVIAHAAVDHGLVKPPLALVELVVATTHTFVPPRGRAHLRLVGSQSMETAEADDPTVHSNADSRSQLAVASTIPSQRDGALHDGALHDGSLNDGAVRDGVVTEATNRFRRGRQDVRPVVDSISPGLPHDAYRHECVMYTDLDSFLANVVPFIKAGVALDQPILVAVIEPRLQALRKALGDDADKVEFVDMAEMGHNPARIIPAWREFAARCGGRPMRGVGEPIWAGRHKAEIVESQLHEALLNVAVTADTPLWLLCPYDVAALGGQIIAEALSSHPFIALPCGEPDQLPPSQANEAHLQPDRTLRNHADSHTVVEAAGDQPDYLGFDHLMALFTADLPAPNHPTECMTLGARNTDDLGTHDLGTHDLGTRDLASRVLNHAIAAGLPTQRSANLATAIGEIASAGARHSTGEVHIRFWQDPLALVCEVGDDGVIPDPMVGRGATMQAFSRERGIRLANELCDLVQVRSGNGGTTVRVLSWL